MAGGTVQPQQCSLQEPFLKGNSTLEGNSCQVYVRERAQGDLLPSTAIMSRQPSPLPHSQQMYHQIPLAPSSSKQKTKSHVAGITAGAEDVKYQAKYKELKKKVKEIELVRRLQRHTAVLDGAEMSVGRTMTSCT